MGIKMKTNELKNLLGMYNLEVREVENIVFVLKEGVTAATISTKYQNCFSTQFIEMIAFCEPERQEIVDLIWEYAGTDMEARKDEKMARLRLDVPLVEFPWYLYKNKHTGDTGITGMKEASENYQTEFTPDELLGLNRTGFKVEVLG